MYPLNVKTAGKVVAFAVARDEKEHAALTAAGYLPALVAGPQEAQPPVPSPLPADPAPVDEDETPEAPKRGRPRKSH